MTAIKLQAVSFSYGPARGADSTPKTKALDQLTLSINKGEYVVVLGRSGSGKSTLLKLCNALLLPTDGAVFIEGVATRDEAQLWEIRRMAGMIFPDPDSQILGATVAEDVAFGPENLGLSPQEIRNRVAAALLAVGMADLADRATHLLSNTQKLRVALAGILAMQPECILVDDATSLLDSNDRREFLQLLRGINRKNDITVVHATRNSEEATAADRTIVLADGKIVSAAQPARLAMEEPCPSECSLELAAVAGQRAAAGAKIR